MGTGAHEPATSLGATNAITSGRAVERARVVDVVRVWVAGGALVVFIPVVGVLSCVERLLINVCVLCEGCSKG